MLGFGGLTPAALRPQVAGLDTSQPRRADWAAAKAAVKGLRLGWVVPGSGRKMTKKAKGLTKVSAAEAMFECEGATISVAAYYRQKHGLKLQHPQLPCADFSPKGSREAPGRPCWVPLELCAVEPGQRTQLVKGGDAHREMVARTAVAPGVRQGRIAGGVAEQRLAGDPTLKAFGLGFSPAQPAMTELRGRLLVEPQARRPDPGSDS